MNSTITKRENLTVAVREYKDNQGDTKKVWKTLGELVTWSDGSQSFTWWGSGIEIKGNVFEQQDRNQQPAPQQQQYQQPQQQGGFQQQQGFQPQQGYQGQNTPDNF